MRAINVRECCILGVVGGFSDLTATLDLHIRKL
jgi:hypothetical protein